MSSPFTCAVVAAMRRLYPETLADKSFDNTGLLLEAPFHPSRRRQNNSVLLTIDLTTAVADEAIERGDSVIVTYHPIIFRALKSLTLQNTQQKTLLRLAAEGISVYSPHTAVDAAVGGNGDWLADIVTGSYTAATAPIGDGKDAATQGKYNVHYHDPAPASSKKHSQIKHTRSVLAPNPTHPDAGIGRAVRFDTPQPLSTILHNVSSALNTPKAFHLALPYGLTIAEMQVSSVAMCAGSGGSVVAQADPPVDMILTGELSHHEALAAVEEGKVVVCLMHSNSERGYLKHVMQEKLSKAVEEEWSRIEREGIAYWGPEDAAVKELREKMEEEGFNVDVSSRDRDPFGYAVFED